MPFKDTVLFQIMRFSWFLTTPIGLTMVLSIVSDFFFLSSLTWDTQSVTIQEASVLPWGLGSSLRPRIPRICLIHKIPKIWEIPDIVLSRTTIKMLLKRYPPPRYVQRILHKMCLLFVKCFLPKSIKTKPLIRHIWNFQ